jgi:GTP-binding protein
LLGTVAIVGFPNVGKSTLVNRLTGTRAAVVHETPGVTRDRKELVCEWRAKRFLLIDTGGVDIADESPITRSIADQAREAVTEADVVLFVTDAQTGVTPGDEEVAQILRTARKPVLVLANKIDDPRQEALALELHRLGLGDPIPISGLHGHGTGDLLDEILEHLEVHGRGARPELPESAIRVAILGRPNVGKSSLLNRLLGRERVIVSEIPGTTRDSIDTVLQRGDRTFVPSTPPASAANAATGRGSSTTASCARSRRRSVPTSRSCSSTRRWGSSTRTSPSPTSRARPVIRL